MSIFSPKQQTILTRETYKEKATRKFKENPWVPLGALATSAALITAMVKMRRGEARSFNNWLRVRVITQGLTIVAVIAGTYSLGNRTGPNTTPLGTTTVEADLERARDQKLTKDRKEFEVRLKAAEDTHNAETRAGLSTPKVGTEPAGVKAARARLEEKLGPSTGTGL